MEKSLDNSEESMNMAPNIDEVKIPEISDFNEEGDDGKYCKMLSRKYCIYQNQ